MPTLRGAPVLLATAAVLVIPSSAAAFATVPEDEVFAREGRRELIHIRIQDGCDDAATDRVEVEVPESVLGVIPQEVPGWTTTTETVETEPYELFDQEQTERISTITWTGGPLAPDMFLDFGITAVFTEPTDELILPVLQGCGEVEQAWDEVPQGDEERSDLQKPAPVRARDRTDGDLRARGGPPRGARRAGGAPDVVRRAQAGRDRRLTSARATPGRRAAP